MTNYLIAIFVALRTTFIPCFCDDKIYGDYKTKIERIGTLPAEIVESSGLFFADSLLLTFNDSGGEPILYGLDSTFTINKTIVLKDIKNIDWESIAGENDTIIYIGDFGNNLNNRTDLSILKYNLEQHDFFKIEFKYDDQKEYPPIKKEQRNFDCEGMIHFDDKLFLFSKNRGNKIITIYSLPDNAKKTVAYVEETFSLNEMITGADFHPESDMVALISYGKIMLFSLKKEEEKILFKPIYCRRFLRAGQSEGIVFKNDSTLYISNEAGKVFEARLKNK